ncbi:unnamed protein product [Caenorhabditis nigoni]
MYCFDSLAVLLKPIPKEVGYWKVRYLGEKKNRGKKCHEKNMVAFHKDDKLTIKTTVWGDVEKAREEAITLLKHRSEGWGSKECREFPIRRAHPILQTGLTRDFSRKSLRLQRKNGTAVEDKFVCVLGTINHRFNYLGRR